MSILFRSASAAIALMMVPPAFAADLVFHQSFEECWSAALTRPVFLDRMRSSIEGTTACIPPQSGSTSGIPYSVCATANGCGSGVAGCPVLIHAGAFSGDFVAGSFSGPGSVDNIAVPINYTLGSCVLTLGAIVMDFDLDYLMRSDGSNGVHADDLATPVATIASYASSGCAAVASLIAPYIATAIVNAQDSTAAAIQPALRANTVGQSVCPLTP